MSSTMVEDVVHEALADTAAEARGRVSLEELAAGARGEAWGRVAPGAREGIGAARFQSFAG